jgi:tRNA (mo5U34)-methyltransferase
MDERVMSLAPSMRAVVRRALDSVSNGDFGQAADLLAGIAPLDPRSRYSLGLCQVGAGRRVEGLANVTAALSDCPGLFPWWAPRATLDLLADVDRALGEDQAADATVRARLSVRLAIAEGLAQAGRASEAADLFVRIIRQARPVDRLSAPTALPEERVREMVAPQPIWHSMDLGTSFVEGRRKKSRVLAGELLRLDLPDLEGKSVLDIGAWDGFFSFECERRGASRVTALEYHSWITDLAALADYASQHRERHGTLPDLYAPPPELKDGSRLPGRRAFDVARELLGSRVEPVCRDVREVDPGELGTFDVVLFLGVLYHLTDPFGALKKVHAFTRDVAVVETLGFHDPAVADRPMWEFYKDDRINGDPTTWWAPNERGLLDLLQAAGFRRVLIKSGVSTLPLADLERPTVLRIIAHAWK